MDIHSESLLRKWSPGAFIGIFLLAAFLRLQGLRTDFWLDEIWALQIVAEFVRNPIDILTRLHLDTNHWLYTYYLFLCGEGRAWWIYRVPSMIAGIMTVPLFGLICGGRDPGKSLTAMVISGFSYLLILYSSEARGYALMILLGLIAYFLLDRYFLEKPKGYAAAFWAVSILGILAHITFLYITAGFILWTWCDSGKSGSGLLHRTKAVVALHGPPLVFLSLLYLVDLRRMILGGAEVGTFPDVLRQLIGFAVGCPEIGILPIIVTVMGIALICFEILLLWFQDRGKALFFTMVLFLVPLTVATGAFFADFRGWQVRYLLACLPFLLMLIVNSFWRAWQSGRGGRALYLCCLGLYLAGNGYYLRSFLKDGRGAYLAAIRYVMDHSAGREITIASDHDFRNKMVLDYYVRQLGRERPFTYYDGGKWPPAGPAWYISHSIKREASVPQSRTAYNGAVYDLVGQFRFSGLSGFHWFLYRKKESKPTPDAAPIR